MQPRNLKRIKEFCRDNPGFSESGIRWMKHCSEPGRKNSRGEPISVNGYAMAFILVNGSWFIDEDKFFEIVEAKQKERGAA